MKQIIILLAMLATFAGAVHSWQERGSYVEAALFSEGFSLSAPVKLRVADYHMQRGMMPSENADVGLPAPKSLYGTSVKRIAINRGGVVVVDFNDRVGEQSMVLIPTVSQDKRLLSWACTSDSIDSDVLDKLIPSCNYQEPTAASNLMSAIANKEAANVAHLLAMGIDPDIVVNRNTPLMLATRVGDVAIVNQLLAAGAEIDKPAIESERITPLMLAITSDRPAVASMLLAKGASVTRHDSRGMSAMDYAVSADQGAGEERFVRMVSSRFNPEFAGLGDVATRKVIAEESEDRRLQALYPEYIWAAQRCHVQRLSSLLLDEQELTSPEIVNGVPLGEHIRLPQCAPILHEHLLTKPSYWRSARAYLAARTQQCDLRAVTRALKDNPDLDVTLDYKGRSLIERAVSSGCHTVLRLMVRERHLAGQLDDDIIVKAISQAPQETLVKLISNLIAAGAKVNGRDSQGRVPLTTAIAHEQPVIAKYLVDAGASFNERTSNGSYPVIEATKKGYEHLVLQMVDKGADINARDSLGRTALFAAVNRGQQYLVRSLINAGADARIADSNGMNALILAESSNLRNIKYLLVASTD